VIGTLLIIVLLALLIFQDSPTSADDDLNLDGSTPSPGMNEVVSDIDKADSATTKREIALIGLVTDDDGVAISGASVRAVRTRSPDKPLILSQYSSYAATAESDGRFVFFDLPPGTYALRATKDEMAGHGSAKVEDPGSRSKEDMKDIEIVMKPAGAITGWVKDSLGKPLKDVLVMPLILRAAITKTNAEGRFSIEGLPMDKHTIVTYSEAHYPESAAKVETGETKLEFTLHPIDEPADPGIAATPPEAGAAAEKDPEAVKRDAERKRKLRRRPNLPPHDPRIRDSRMRNKLPPGFDPRRPGRVPPTEGEGENQPETPPKKNEENG
jgi:hypothetical protein